MTKDDLHAEIADLRERVARLEDRAFPPDERANPLAEAAEEKFATASDAARRYPIGQVRALSYFRIHRPGDDEYGKLMDDRTADFEALLALPADGIANSLSGLAHPARIAIYKALLTGSPAGSSPAGVDLFPAVLDDQRPASAGRQAGHVQACRLEAGAHDD